MGPLDKFDPNDVQMVNTFLVGMAQGDVSNLILGNPRVQVYMAMRREFCQQQGLDLNEQLMAGDLIFAWILGYADFQRQMGAVMTGELSGDSAHVPELGNAEIPLLHWVKDNVTWDDVLHDLLLGGDDDDDDGA